MKSWTKSFLSDRLEQTLGIPHRQGVSPLVFKPTYLSKLTRRRKTQLAALVLLGLAVIYAGFVWTQFVELDRRFNAQVQFTPTRVYSDLARLAPSQPRAYVEHRLLALAYPIHKGAEGMEFTLRDARIPAELVPTTEGATPLNAAGKSIRLEFESAQPQANLFRILVDGAEVQELFLEPELVATFSRSGDTQIRERIALKDIPPAVWKSIIAIEDQHFLEHKGLDPRGLLRALWVDLRTLSLAQGGSTLTQQLVKNLMVRRSKNVFKKISELFLAVLLELRYEKETILERYLNEVALGQIGNLEIRGVSEGAKHFFGKTLADLNLAEITLLAGLIKGPAYYSPYKYLDRALARQKLVLAKLGELGLAAPEELKAAETAPLRLAPPQLQANKAPYFSDYVKAELLRRLAGRFTEEELPEAGLRVYTTLNPWLNERAQLAVDSGVAAIEKRFPGLDTRIEGAAALVDHTTDSILALIGGRSYRVSTFNRVLNMRRQVGSTFKPIVYASAFRKEFDTTGVPYSAAYPISDSRWKLTYDRGRQSWEPRNYEKDFLGWIPLRTALAHSVNTSAARLGIAVGIDSVVQTARDLGIEAPLDAVPSLSLGVAELTPVELLRAYATLANHGARDDLTVIRVITEESGTLMGRYIHNPRPFLSPTVADMTMDLMQDVFTEGTARGAREFGLEGAAAGKTGTTSQYRDAWFAGSTPKVTAVVWVGADQSGSASVAPSAGKSPKTKSPKLQLTGAGAALPIWVELMKASHDLEPAGVFVWDPDLVEARFDRYSGKVALDGCPASQTRVERVPRAVANQSPRGCESSFPEPLPTADGP